jgi:hypothetical protein
MSQVVYDEQLVSSHFFEVSDLVIEDYFRVTAITDYCSFCYFTL